jgi:transcriptional regulator with XRE-family HTH domain
MTVAVAPAKGVRIRFATKPPSLATIAARIRQVREMRGYSVTDTSEMLGIAKQTISQWELGQCRPRMDHLVLFAEAMRVDLGDVFSGVGLKQLTPIKPKVVGLRPATQLVPLVPMRKAGAYLMNTTELPDDVKRVPTYRHHPKGSIAFTISGRSMEPWGREGDVITLVPTEGRVDPGKLVLAHIEGRPEPIVFRRYLPAVEGEGHVGAKLRSLNGIDPDIVMKAGDKLLGVMLEHTSTHHD